MGSLTSYTLGMCSYERRRNMFKKIIISAIALYCAVSLWGLSESLAEFSLFNGRIESSVWLDEYLTFREKKHPEQRVQYSQALVAWRHRAQADILFKLYNCGDTIINFYTWLQYYYDSGPDVNDKINRAMDPGQKYHKYQAPFWARDDILQEAYLDINKGPLSVRIGKQKVIWGDLELAVTTDIVNPLDLRYSSPGIDDLDVLKIPLWMIKTIYQSSLPGELLFEFLVNPGDYQSIRLGVQGSDRGSPSVPNEELGGLGITGAVAKLQNRSEPRFSLNNFAMGGRVRGLTRFSIAKSPYELMWTLQYYTSPSQNTMVVDKVEEYRAWAAGFAARRADGIIGNLPEGRIYDARRYHMLGLSMQTFDPLLTKAVFIGEFAYFFNQSYNTTDRTNGVTGPPTERDYFTYGLSCRRPLETKFLKKIDPKSRGFTEMDLSIYQGWIVGQDVWKLKRQFSYGYRSTTTFSLQLMTAFVNQTFTPVFRVLYNTRNYGYWSLSVVYSLTTQFQMHCRIYRKLGTQYDA